ncbi:zf-HC2 domain-containing protein [Couchioplanes caeruleus]|uniref:zf-HC2 domain-containing protein n=1 Tax=Couchioplanes caeruleus TaxID=56438 RepID=UPI0011CE125D|nr:zf-HC2 domain-containing protein [Couchioplanes caeruleus]
MDEDLAGRYAAGSTDLVLAASVEAHLLECAACRDSVTAVVSAQRLADIWAGVNDHLDASPTLAERLRSWRSKPLSARFAIAVTAAAVAAAVVAVDLKTDHFRGHGSSPYGQVLTRPTTQNINTENEPGLAALAAGLTTVDGRLMSSYDPPPYRVTLGDTTPAPAAVTERTISGITRKVVPQAAVIYSASATWVYIIAGPHEISRQRVAVSAENDGIATLSDGPPAGTRVLTFRTA